MYILLYIKEMAYGYKRRYTRRTYKPKKKGYAKVRVGRRFKPKYKRTFKKVRKVYSAKLQTQRMPLTKIVKMRYFQTINLALVAATPQAYNFSCNSIFDPNVTGTGHQPSNYDFWATQYTQYQVIGSKCTVKYVRQNTLQTEIWYTVNVTEAIANAPISTNAMLEFGKKPQVGGSWVEDNRNTAKAYYSANKWFKRKVLQSGGGWIGFGNNANDPVYFQIMAVCEPSNQTDTFLVEIEYTVALSGRIDDNTIS